MTTITINSIDIASKTLERVFKRKAEALVDAVSKEAIQKIREGLRELAAEAAIEVSAMFAPDRDGVNVNLVFKEAK